MDQKNEKHESVCNSVFKNGSSTTKELFTEKWIKIINNIEKNKAVGISM